MLLKFTKQNAATDSDALVSDLALHPQNAAIYGTEDVSELVDKIAASNWIKPLVVNRANLRVISGHRRLFAARQLGLIYVPVEYRDFASETDELEALLLENANRDKTPEQKVREAAQWERIEGERARNRQAAAAQQTNAQLGRSSETLPANLPEASKGETREKVAGKVGMKPRTYEKASKVVAKADDLTAQGKQGEAQSLLNTLNHKSVDAAYKSVTKTNREAAFAAAPAITNIQVLVADIRQGLPLQDDSLDLILTDPPYPGEYLPLYEILAREAARVLKPGGSLAVMCGQYHLPDIFRLMRGQLSYRWTLAYLTPGGQSVQIHPRKVNCFWKPVLLFVKGEIGDQWMGDVAKSSVNDNDKRFHGWGQSESGMMDLVERLSSPGDLICDPFVGGGATGVAAIALKRRFIGFDIDPDCIKISRERLAQCLNR